MSQDLHDKKEIIDYLMKTFRIERFMYIFATFVIFGVMLYVGVQAYLTGKVETRDFVALFSSSGAITFTASRLLRMFDQCIEFLSDKPVKSKTI